jgi:hypothetical protein
MEGDVLVTQGFDEATEPVGESAFIGDILPIVTTGDNVTLRCIFSEQFEVIDIQRNDPRGFFRLRWTNLCSVSLPALTLVTDGCLID